MWRSTGFAFIDPRNRDLSSRADRDFNHRGDVPQRIGVRGDTPAALVALEGALARAEPEGYVRVFVAEGRTMAELLKDAVKRGIATDYARQLLPAFGNAEVKGPVRRDLIEPLSDRELDVLRLLGTELDGPEIARELTVSLNTVRTHTKNLYSKLGVNNRRAAVKRAEELQLLSQP